MPAVHVIAAVDAEGGIGKLGAIPWRHAGELRHFRAVTTAARRGRRNAVIMGRRTWESLPKKPLPDRHNIVVTRTPIPGVATARSFDEAVAAAAAQKADTVFAIGGARIYADALAHPACERAHLTRIPGTHDCDAFFPLAALTQHGYTSEMMLSKPFMDPELRVEVWVRR